MNKKEQSKRKGQIQISFGIIFSIIIIIATLAVAGYVIAKFYNIGTKVSCGLYFNGLQKEIKHAYYSQGEVQDIFKEKTPSGINEICFGNSTQTLLDKKAEDKFNEFKFYSKPENNMFFWPRDVCDDKQFSYTLKNAETDGFFCVPVAEGKASVKISKGEFDALVKISK